MIYPIAIISRDATQRLDMLARIQARFARASVQAHFVEFEDASTFDNHEHFEAIFIDCEDHLDYIHISQEWFQTYRSHMLFLAEKLSYQVELKQLIYAITLLKQDYADRFERAIDSVLDSLYLNNYVQNFETLDGKIQRIPLQDILYIDHHDRHTDIHTQNQGIVHVQAPLYQVLEAYNTYHLCPINKGVIVNWMHIKNLNNKHIYLRNGECLKVATRRFKEVHASFLFFCDMPN